MFTSCIVLNQVLVGNKLLNNISNYKKKAFIKKNKCFCILTLTVIFTITKNKYSYTERFKSGVDKLRPVSHTKNFATTYLTY